MSSIGEGLNLGKITVEQLQKIRTELKVQNLIDIKRMDREGSFLTVEQRSKLTSMICKYVDNLK